jgi:phospholipase/carboxylesterase
MLDKLKDWLEHYAGLLKLAGVGVLVAAFALWWFTDPPVWVGPSAGANSRVLILLHGHGASKTDLKPLAEKLLQAAPNVSFVLPSAPHSVGAGKTWFPSFREDSQQAVDQRMLELRAQARAVVAGVIDDLKGDGVPAAQIYVGGFSQGATVALDVVLSNEGAELGGLVSLSGGAVKIDLAPLTERAQMQAFVSHGDSDRVLGSSSSKELAAALKANDHEVQFVQFKGGHTIPPEVVQPLGEFLQAL